MSMKEDRRLTSEQLRVTQMWFNRDFELSGNLEPGTEYQT